MASNIDITKPVTGNATTQSVRDNFSAAKTEIEALQNADPLPSGTDTQTLRYNGTVVEATSSLVIDSSGNVDIASGDLAVGDVITTDVANDTVEMGYGVSGNGVEWNLKDKNGGNTHIGWIGSGATTGASNYYSFGSTGLSRWRSYDGTSYTTAMEISAAGDLTLLGTVDGRDVAADGTKLDGIDTSANNYVHPSYASTNIDTSGATIVDIITTNSTGHVTALGTRTLTAANLGALKDTDDTFTGTMTVAGDLETTGGTSSIFNCTAGAEGHSSNVWPIQIVQPTAQKDAMMSFHVSGDYAVNFGMDGSTNKLSVGGWSMAGAMYEIYHSGNKGDANTLGGRSFTDASTGSTIAGRDSAGDIHARLFRSEYDTTNASIGYIMTQVDTVSNNYIRPSTMAQVKTSLFSDNDLTFAQGGGWFQQDTTWVRSKANKRVYNASTNAAAFATPGDFTAGYSDMRLKTHRGMIENALDKVCTLDGFYYERNEKAIELGYEGGELRVGLSAQQVKEVLPEVIKSAPINIDQGTDYMTLDYERVVPLLVEAIKELKEELDLLKGA
jgi:hypothetical protein